MLRSTRRVLVFAAGIGVAASACWGQGESRARAVEPRPVAGASAPVAASEIIAFVVAVEGRVDYKPSDEARFVVATKGMRLKQGGTLRTGLRSKVQFQVGAGQLFTID